MARWTTRTRPIPHGPGGPMSTSASITSADRHLLQYAELFEAVIGGEGARMPVAWPAAWTAAAGGPASLPSAYVDESVLGQHMLTNMEATLERPRRRQQRPRRRAARGGGAERPHRAAGDPPGRQCPGAGLDVGEDRRRARRDQANRAPQARPARRR